MRWCVIRHPDLGVAVVAEDSLSAHEPRGWVRTSPLVDDQYSLNPADYPLPDPVVVEQSADVATDVAVDPTTDNTPTVQPRPTTKTRRSTED